MFLMGLVALLAASLSAKAQEITITLEPGWNWISYPNAEEMDVASALGDFVPMSGDIVRSRFGSSTYINGRWRGAVTHFIPGWGYMYYSSRTEDVEFVFAQPSSNVVATATPTVITATSAVVGGMVMLPEGSHVFLRGVCWSTDLDPDIDGSHTSDGMGIGSFNDTLEGLNMNTTYYVRAYAVSEYGLAYGNVMTFTTMSGIPQVSTTGVTDITINSAVCGGTVTDDGGLDITACGVCWSEEPNPTIEDSHTSEETSTGSFSSSLTNLDPGTVYYVRAYVTNAQATYYGGEIIFTTLDYGYIDLGLPSGLLWATCNVGAETPESYGNYYAWGETQPKSVYGWSTYQYCIYSRASHLLIKYCNNSSYGYNGFTDNLTTLKPIDDAATANWGGAWRMPAKEEWQELLNNTTSTWTIQNGVNGWLFTASNGNSLFLPAAGVRREGNLDDVGSAGNYRSSSLVTDNPYYAWSFNFNSDGCNMFDNNRAYGRSVRAVRYASQSMPFVINATANPSGGGEVSGGGNYQEGFECTLIATANTDYTFINWTENDSVVSTDATYTFIVNADRTLVANFSSNFPTGAINGLFSVSASRQVYFSQGNLQYIGSASTPYWKFADNQWDYFGSSQANTSQTTDRDLFGWGTSGWNNGNTYYHPWDTNNSNGSLYGPKGSYNLTGSYANADWGVYNPISNGGNQANYWRTLTKNEWVYVFNTRSTTSGIRYVKAKVNGVNGIILLPDNWSTSYYTLSNANQSGAAFNNNTITSSQWDTLEQHGAVFLPAAGYLKGAAAHVMGSQGYYWSSSYEDSSVAYEVYFISSGVYPSNYFERYHGFSVRLVHNAD